MDNCLHITYPIPTQEKTEWCWAAVTNYIDMTLRERPYFTQCNIAQKRTPNLCIQDCSEVDCNRWNYLDESLADIGRLRGKPKHQPMNPHEVIREIDNFKPVGVRIQWPPVIDPEATDGHFVAILGYFFVGDTLFYQVYNPADEVGNIESVKEIDLRQKYRGSGYWTHSFLTQ